MTRFPDDAASPARRFTASDGVALAYRDTGAGMPLVCLPGLTRNGLDFDPVVEHFAGDLRIIRPDMRGRGASDRDPDHRNYNIGVEARDVLELLAHLELDRVALLGTSRGGQIAMVLAHHAGDRLRGVALNDIGPEVDPVGLDRIMSYLGVVPDFPTLDAAAAGTAAAMAAQFPGVGAAQWRTYLARVWEETPDGLALRYDPDLRRAIADALAAGPLPDLWPLFDAMEGLPLLLLRGANSDILSAATADEMARRRPDMVRVEVADRGHVPFLDEPEVVAAFRGFLDRLG